MTGAPFAPPLEPMEARVRETLPTGDLAYEPKWDGFRALAWGADGTGDERLDSRKTRPLLRYFPELRPLLEALPRDAVVDGEIVCVRGGRTDFDALSQRIHPAESRINRLAAETPCELVAFDLLAWDGDDLRERPYAERRGRLLAADLPAGWHTTPSTTDPELADRWMVDFDAAGCDGIVAKRLDGPYVEGRREMIKVKLRRSIDAVVGGYRWHKLGDRVGSLLLGLYDERGEMHFVGHTASFSDDDRKALLGRVRPLEVAQDEGFGDARRPGEPSRWDNDRTLEWVALRQELVCQVSVDQFTGHRFRHAARFERWRPDKEADPNDCPLSQIAPPPGPDFGALVGGSRA